MNTVNLTKLHESDRARVFRNALKQNANPRGTCITYHQGDFGDEIGTTELGRIAWEAYERGDVALVQKTYDMGQHLYMAVVK